VKFVVRKLLENPTHRRLKIMIDIHEFGAKAAINVGENLSQLADVSWNALGPRVKPKSIP
jgi:hypothetical protein